MQFLQNPKILEQLQILQSELPFGLWETLYALLLETALAYLIGLPLGVMLFTGEKDGVRPLPGWFMKLLNLTVNLLRSVPFLILMIVVLPLSKLLVGTRVGTAATIVPMVIAAFPMVARMVESALREVDRGVIEAAQAMGASALQIVWKVILPEAKPSLISGASISMTTILGYGAMAGIIGGGGLGKIAINYGYYNFKDLVMWVSVLALVLLVQIFQTIGTKLATACDKRLRHK